MAKEKITPESPETTPSKLAKPTALEVDAPLISSEVDSTVEPSRMKGSYLTVDSRMDSSDITVKFSAKEAPELELEDIVDSSGESGARKIAIPLHYLTALMGFTALIGYIGKSQGQAAVSLIREVGISFYPASESENLAPRLFDEKIVHNTPTYDMNDHTGDETVLVPVPYLAKEGDKVYCTAATEQDAPRHVFYTVIYDHALTADEAVEGYVLKPTIARGWLARRKPWRSLTLQSAWITSDLPAEPPADVDPHLETRLPRNALEIQYRRTAALIVAPGLELPPPHLRQSVQYNGQWCLNPELTKGGGDVDAPHLDTYADDQVCFYVSGPSYGKQPLGCVTIEHNGDPASVALSPCIVACFFDKPMTLSYTLQFPNSEEPQQSPEQRVNVLVPQFPHPGIEEATNGTVDLRTFSGDALATVPVWDYAECSNRCWMWGTGEREDGSDYRFDILTGALVTDDWKNHGVESTIPRQALQQLADCSDFELHFAASFCDASALADAHLFPARVFNIEQEPLVLPEPTVTEAVGSDLTAWNGRNGVHVEVDYIGNNPKHTITVCWSTPSGACWPLASQPGSTAGAVIFALPAQAVIESMGKTVPITYTVTTACKVQTAPPLNLKISIPVRLPTPVVRQATPPATQDGILDLRTFTGNADIDVEKWWFILLEQIGWMRGVGVLQNGNPYSFDVYLTKPVTDVDEGMVDIVSRSHLAVLKSGSHLTFTFNATPDGSTNESNAITFPSLRLIFLAGYYDFTTFDGGNRNGWLDGAASQGENRYTTVFGKSCIANGTASSGTAGIILYKDVTGLEVGRSYHFSMLGCTYNGAAPLPQLSLMTNAGAVTPVTTFSAMAWRKIEGTFVATGSSMQLRVMSWLASGADGNDFAMTDLLVEDL